MTENLKSINLQKRKAIEQERMRIISDVTKTMNAITSSTPQPSSINISFFNKKKIFSIEQSPFKLQQLKSFKDKLKNESETPHEEQLSTIFRSKNQTLTHSRSISLIPKCSSNNNNNCSSNSILPNIITSNSHSSIREHTQMPFCPQCEHCKSLSQSKTIDEYVHLIKEGKSIITKGCEYIIENSCLENLDKIFHSTNPETQLMSDEEYKQYKTLKDKQIFNIEELLLHYKNNTTSQVKRNTYLIVSTFMDNLIDGNIDIESIIPQHLLTTLKAKLLSKGRLYDTKNDKVVFDPDIEALFDIRTKQMITKLFKKKYLNSLNQLKKDNDKLYETSMHRHLILFLIFIQILSEIHSDNKDKAILLYKFFTNFFVEQDKKWIYVVSKMKEKVKIYKNLCKAILTQKNKNVDKIEDMNNVLFSNKVTKDNLEQHKSVISELLRLVNEKREEIYQLEAKMSIMQHELQFWVHDFDNIKLDNNIREKRKQLNIEEMLENIKDEMKHKHLSKVSQTLILNSDIYLILSGQRNYFFEQKKFYVQENRRLAGLVNHKQMRKKYYKDLLKENDLKFQKEKAQLEEDITFLRDKLSCDKEDKEIQTECDLMKYNKLIKNNDLIIIHKRLTQNKLISFVEKVNYGCSRVKPLSKESILNLIPDLYSHKFQDDNDREKENLPKQNFDTFFLSFMQDKFKLKKLINKHAEETISGVINYDKDDNRILLFKRFLGIDKHKIYREVLDVYLVLLQNLPMALSKLFYDNNYMSFLMETNYCFDILHNRLSFYNILSLLKDTIIMNSNMYEYTSKEMVNVASQQKKMEYYYLNRFAEKSIVYFNSLVQLSKNNVRESNLMYLVTSIVEANAVLGLDREKCVDVLKRNFKVDEKRNVIELDSFLEFFVNKVVFKIQVYEYCEFVFKGLVMIYQNIENKINHVLIELNISDGLIYYKEFEVILMKLINNNEIRWKLPNYFNDACGSDSRDFISKEELVSFVMNSKDLLSILFLRNNEEIEMNEKKKTKK